MQARIYRPSKTAMQSGPAGNSKSWVLEYEPLEPKLPDSLMGWSGSADTQQQVTLKFETADEAVAYAKRHNLDYTVQSEPKKPFRPKNYADNFKFDKLEFGRF
jgi:hypothetical protein